MHNPASALEQLALLRLDDTPEIEESKTDEPMEKRRRTGRAIKDLTGQRFGKLVVLSVTDERQHGNVVWVCRCDCGSTIRLSSANFRSGTKSCGCLGKGIHKHTYIRGGVGSRRQGVKSLPRQEGQNFRDLFAQYRAAAIKRGYRWSLDYDQFAEITKRDCHYCGAAPQQTHIGRRGYTDGQPYIYNGIDRTNNNKGYEVENVVACCGVCNVAKRDRNHDEFIEWARRIVEHCQKIA